MTEAEYGTDFWIQFQTGPQHFKTDPWTGGNRGLHALAEDRTPGIYGKAGDSYKTPSRIEWIKDGKRYLIETNSGIGLVMEFSLKDPDDPFSGEETFSRMDDNKFAEAVEHALTVPEIVESKLLDGIAAKRKLTLEAETQRS